MSIASKNHIYAINGVVWLRGHESKSVNNICPDS